MTHAERLARRLAVTESPKLTPPSSLALDQVSVLYIAGIGRSGSTLLCRTLGTVDGFLATGELMRIISRGVASGDLCSCGDAVRRCTLWGPVIEHLETQMPSIDYARLEATRRRLTEGWSLVPYLALRTPPRAMARELEEYRRFLTTLYRSIRAVTGARVIVDASKNLMFAKMLTETSGVHVRVLHLVRDSRGVAYSLTKKQPRPGTAHREENFEQFGVMIGSILWTAAHLTTETFRRRSDVFVRVRYEDFVSNPSLTVGRVLRETYPEHAPPSLERVNAHSVELGSDHLIASNPNRSSRGMIELKEDVAWRRHMSRARRVLVTALTFPLLRRYGYGRAGRRDVTSS